MTDLRLCRLEVYTDSPTSTSLELRFFDGDGEQFRRIPRTEVQDLVGHVERLYSRNQVGPLIFGHRDMQDLGERLYQFLNGPHGWLAKNNHAPGNVLRLDADEQLRHLPWELLVSDDSSRLAVSLSAPLAPIRSVGPGANRPDPSVENRPLRTLFMAASPEGSTRLDYEKEEDWILRATQEAGAEAELVVEESGTLEGLQYLIDTYGREHFDVLHLSGHATVDGSNPLFQLEDEVGRSRPTTPEELVGALRNRWPRLVFVSGCLTGNAPDQGKLPSMAEALVTAGAPHVLGWGLPVGDLAASQFAASLYRRLAVGDTIDRAVVAARADLHADQNPFWHYLRHYCRDEESMTALVTAPSTPGRAPIATNAAAESFVDPESFLDPTKRRIRVATRSEFVGRRRPIQRCLRALRGGQHEGLFIHGMGGLGKSTVASRLAERLPQHNRVIFYQGVDETKLRRQLLDEIAYPSMDQQLEATSLLEHQAPLRVRLEYLFRGPLAGVPCIFVFDDFENGNLATQGDTHVMVPEIREILDSLLRAIRVTNSASRVIITSRYLVDLPEEGSFHVEQLTTLKAGDQAKKLANLEHLRIGANLDETVRQRAIAAAAGNPRLLEWLDRTVADKDLDVNGLLQAIEGEADRFRQEDIFADTLLDMMVPEVQTLVARLNVVDRPVPLAAVRDIHDTPDNDSHIDRAAKVGLIEIGYDTDNDENRYFVSNVLRPLLEPRLDASELKDACAAAARSLYRLWIRPDENDTPGKEE